MTGHKPLWTIMVYISGDDVLDNFAVESLKQLRNGAGDGVTVHYLFDPNDGAATPKSQSYNGQRKNADASVFTGAINRNAFLPKAMRGKNSRINSADPAVLRTFINSVTHGDSPTGVDDPNHHYGLILWCHGPELLLDAEQPRKNRSGARLDGKYLTPAKLGEALKSTKLLTKRPLKAGTRRKKEAVGDYSRKLDFIAFDACSMSMVEVASELQDYADFMIASQDDVPDQSLPYEKILSLLKGKIDVREACREIPEEYKNAFQDYFAAPGPAITNTTLASLNLQNVDKVTVPLGELSATLQRLAFASRDARKAIIRARRASRSFVLGLFVDIYDFCKYLQKEKAALGRDVDCICQEIRDALTIGHKNELLLNNQTNEKGEVRCHGLSIYLPYLTAKESLNLEKSLTIGGTGIMTQLSKGASTTNLHKGGSTTNLHKSRAARIAETEKDLASLTCFNEKTGWKKFIKETWSYILAKEEPRQLDLHYSGQQCAMNLLSLYKASGKRSRSKIGALHIIGGGRKHKRQDGSGDLNISGKGAA